jgi:hypothetical protein
MDLPGGRVFLVHVADLLSESVDGIVTAANSAHLENHDVTTKGRRRYSV